MSMRAYAFVEGWIQEHVHPLMHDEHRHGHHRFAAACLAAAQTCGIQASEVTSEFGDLTEHIDGVIEHLIDHQKAHQVR